MSGRKNRKRKARCIFPEYRWCGPGCSGPGLPINDVDACCQRHDLCLDRGFSSCKCDQAFIECLRPKINTHTQKGRNAALMYKVMKLKMLFTCGS